MSVQVKIQPELGTVPVILLHIYFLLMYDIDCSSVEFTCLSQVQKLQLPKA